MGWHPVRRRRHRLHRRAGDRDLRAGRDGASRCGARSSTPASSRPASALATHCGSRPGCRCTGTSSVPASRRCRPTWPGSSPSTSLSSGAGEALLAERDAGVERKLVGYRHRRAPPAARRVRCARRRRAGGGDHVGQLLTRARTRDRARLRRTRAHGRRRRRHRRPRQQVAGPDRVDTLRRRLTAPERAILAVDFAGDFLARFLAGAFFAVGCLLAAFLAARAAGWCSDPRGVLGGGDAAGADGAAAGGVAGAGRAAPGRRSPPNKPPALSASCVRGPSRCISSPIWLGSVRKPGEPSASTIRSTFGAVARTGPSIIEVISSAVFTVA